MMRGAQSRAVTIAILATAVRAAHFLFAPSPSNLS
jgi:hypothetical protein